MAVKVVIDSGSDINFAEANENGLGFLPMQVSFGDEVFKDGVDLSHRQFYEKLVECDELPKTSQISPYEFESAFREAIDAGDDVVAITISSRLSGTYQSAMIAAGEFPGRVHVVDSENACVGERILIHLALRLRDEGFCAADIAARLNGDKKRIHVLALLDTLEYLKKGGRVSALTAFAGGILGIKPVVAIENGKVSVVGKARGSKQGNNLLVQLVEKTGGIDFDLPLALGYSGLSDILLQKYISDSAALWAGKTSALPIYTIGSTIGTHAGPGAIVLAFFEK